MAATEDEPMAAASEGTGAVMINTGGGGVKIGSSDPKVQKMVEDITDEDEKRGVLAFLKEQAKKEKFQDALSIRLNREMKKAHHTRAKIRVKMPDGYIL